MPEMYDNVKVAEPLFQEGLRYLKSRDYHEAVRCFDKAIEIDSKFALAWSKKGQALKELGNYEEAVRCFDNAIQIDPKNALVFNEKGVALLDSKEYNEAVRCFDKAIEIEKKPIHLCNKGLALFMLEKNNEAIECYGKAIEINPNLADAWKDVGLVLKDSRRYREAVRCFDKAIEIDSNLADAWLDKGLILKESGQKQQEAVRCFDKAIECFDKNLKKDSKDAIDWYGKGHALTQLDKYNEAIEHFNKAIELNPQSINALNQKGKALYLQRRYEEAIECYDAILKIKEYEDAYFFRGQSKCALKDYTDALEDFHKVSDQFPFYDEKITSIGQCYYELGFYEDAESHYRKAIKSNPKLVRAYYNLAALYISEKKYDRARKQLETCSKINRNFSDARDAINRLDGATGRDWYNWWFNDWQHKSNSKNKQKDPEIWRNKRLDIKPMIGTIVMAFIAGLTIATIILAFSYPSSLAPSVAAALTFLVAMLIGVVLLPSLVGFKAVGIQQLESEPFVITSENLHSLQVIDKSHHEVLLMRHNK